MTSLRSRKLYEQQNQQVTSVSYSYDIKNEQRQNLIYRLISNTYQILTKPNYTRPVCLLLLLVELCICVVILKKAKYTEIDWSTYMQQVECFLNGTRNYTEISGSTGPIVYPAGHLYIYTLLYWLTDHGTNIARAQIIFAGLYLINLTFVFTLYHKTQVVSPIGLVFMCLTSYRVHSIYMLRLFNDPIAMFFLYVTINLCLCRRWWLASIVFSLAFSIKMNVLLFAPGFLLLLLEQQSVWRALVNVTSIAIVQIAIGWPFLREHPFDYLTRSFELGRVFMFQWTVNYRFLPENLFLDKQFHLLLLALHLLVLIVYFFNRIKNVIKSVWTQIIHFQSNKRVYRSDRFIVTTLFVSNLIGICFARSLHYQFYVWYFNQLPFLLWIMPFKFNILRLCVLIAIELCWNTYPSTVTSSATLQALHVCLLIGLFLVKPEVKSNTSLNKSRN